LVAAVGRRLLSSLRASRPSILNSEYEARVLGSLAGGVGIPFVRWFGTESDYNVMVLDLLGPSLEVMKSLEYSGDCLRSIIILIAIKIAIKHDTSKLVSNALYIYFVHLKPYH
jgi:hypothetical protein